MQKFPLNILTAAVIAASLSACGGGGGIAGIGGSGIVSPGGGGSVASSSGTIDGFGSIFVNGVRWNTDNVDITIDGVFASESDLGLGMVVDIRGTLNEDLVSGTASTVTVNDEVEGPISAIEIDGDNDAKLMTILGILVIVERTGTVFEGVEFDTLSANDVIEVSGFRENGTRLRATRIEKKSVFVPGQSEVQVTGTISELNQDTFKLGELLVNFSEATLQGLPGGALSNGQAVEVDGIADETLVRAVNIKGEQTISNTLEIGDNVSVEGVISNLEGTRCQVDGIPVDFSEASITPLGFTLKNGVVVDAAGTWNGSVVVAESVVGTRGRIEIEATVESITANTIQLRLFNGSVTILVDNNTRLDDDTGVIDRLSISDLRAGDFLEVEALQDGSELIATRIDRDDLDDDVIQAAVTAFESGASVTVLGITYRTDGAEFEDQANRDLSATDFYNQLQVGDLIKLKDDLIPDGVADEVEFESQDSQDGGGPFEDDPDD